MRKYIKPRAILTSTLSFLASWAIAKHKIRVCVVVGTNGSAIVKEILYTVLKERTNVRRNIEDIWWDLSVPLSVLGYEDKQRSFLEWVNLCISAFGAILKNKSNPHLLILNADTKNPSTANYWSNFLNPEYLIVLNYKKNDSLTESLLANTLNNNGKIVLQNKLDSKLFSSIPKKNLFTYGIEKSNLLLKKLSDGRLRVSYKSQKVILPKKLWPSVSMRISGAIFSVALLEGHDLNSTAYACLKYTFPQSMLRRIKNNLLNSQTTI